jgi:hypothetical protein
MAEYPVEYNGTIATGGDSLHDDLNIFYSVCGSILLSVLRTMGIFSSQTY